MTNAIPRTLLLLLLTAGLGTACQRPDVEREPELVSQSTAAEAPAIGQAESSDEADRSCGLVMRDLGRLWGDDGEYLTACDEGGCHYVWEGRLDVSSQAFRQAEGVGVLYHLQGEEDWWQVTARPEGPGNPGYLRLVFRMDAHLPGPDWDPAELSAARIEFIPFLLRADGSRLFDHNRLPGDFDNYLAEGDRSFYLGMDAAVCNHRPDTAALQFTDSWAEFPLGEPKAGGRLAIHYDLGRLTDCAQSPDLDVQAFVQVNDDGPLLSGSVFDRDEEGHPYAWPLLLDLPEDARRLTVWFVGAGGGCEAYDSDYGRNFVFELERRDPACEDIIRSGDRYGGESECLDYELAGEYDADYCEFAVSGFGDSYEGHYGIPFRWLDVWLWEGDNEGEVLNAGLYVSFRDPGDASDGLRWVLGERDDSGAWRCVFTYLFTGYMGSGSYRYEIQRFAFFIDVRRPSGEVVRLWQSAGGANYVWSDAFSLTPHTESIPYGRIQWAHPDAALFDNYRACR